MRNEKLPGKPILKDVEEVIQSRTTR
jgi:hypothetical protein